MDNPIKGLLCATFIWVLVNPTLTLGFSCDDESLLPCDTTKECYKVSDRCNGVWDCSDKSDEADCTTDSSVTKHGVFGKGTLSKGQNLAWLVTPILLLLGAAYGIYKCAKDGICVAIKKRLTRGRTAESRASDYHPLHQVSFCTSTRIPCTQLGIDPATLTPEQQQQLMLVHNQSFSIQIQGQGAENLGAEGAVALPPTYEEATSAMSDGKGGTIIMMKDGRMVAIPRVGLMLPPYSGSSHTNPANRSGPMLAAAPHMEAIEELEEEIEEEDNPESADEETFFLPRDSQGEGTSRGGRRRHHSQWSNKQRSENRRRHHSCPS